MNKEPIGLYILRYVLALGLFAFMAMLYWSSVLIEEDIQEVRSSLTELHNDITQLRADTEKIRDDVLSTLVQQQSHQVNNGQALQTQPKDIAAQTEDAYPNLLTSDPFYQVTLPKMLGPNFKPTGIRRAATVGVPNNLHPFSNWSNVATWVGQCSVAVSTMHFGIYETMAPDMALKLEERKDSQGRSELWVHLRDNVFWQPLDPALLPPDIKLAPHFQKKHQVIADDFKFYFDAVMNPWVQQPGAVSLRNYLGDIEEFRVIDKLTFVVRWKTDKVTSAGGKVENKIKYIAKSWTGNLTPLASFVYQYFADGTKIVTDDKDPETYRKNSAWAQNFNDHWARNIIVSCGPWIFTGMTEREISFRRNPEYYLPYAALSEGMEVQFKETPEAVWQEFKAGKLDSYDLRPDELLEYQQFLESPTYKQQAAQQGMAVKRLDFVDRSFSYIGWNEAKVQFQSAKVRRALTMAIDRNRIIKQYLNGQGVEINGPFYRYSKDYDASITPWPYDPEEARRLLSEEGWNDTKGTGVIDKTVDGKSVPFRFTLTYYVKSPTAKAISEYIAQAVKEVGIVCDLHGVDVADLSAAFDDKSFDAIFLAWEQGSPPEEPKQLWYSSGAHEKGSSNSIGFANREVDKIIDTLQYEYGPEKRIDLYHRFDAIMHQEAPYTFMYTPKAIFIYRDYVQNVFLPTDRKDLVPGADVAQPQANVFWLKH